MSLLVAVVVLGLLASLSPSTIVVFILLLSTTRAKVNAVAFLIGWSASLAVVFGVSYAVGGARATQQGTGRAVVGALELLLGAVLLGAAARQWRRRDRPRTPSGMTRRFTSRLKALTPWEAALVGVFEQPWTLTAAAAVVVVRHHVPFRDAVVAFVVFTLVSTATVGLIYLYYTRRPGPAVARLAVLRDRLGRAGPTIFVVVSSAVGAYLVVDGVRSMVGA